MGDMLVKAGEHAKAKAMYSAAKLSPSYNDWFYKDEIEKPINEMSENMEAFNRKQNLIHLSGKRQMMRIPNSPVPVATG